MQSTRWLLDANVTHILQEFLSDRGITCSNAQAEGRAELTNGRLVQAAVDGGFRVLLQEIDSSRNPPVGHFGINLMFQSYFLNYRNLKARS
jgi:hypothetical protein